MPSLGLLLESPIFDSYNNRMKAINEKLPPDDKDRRPPIEFDIYAQTIADFKQEHIYSRMRDVEDRGGVYVFISLAVGLLLSMLCLASMPGFALSTNMSATTSS